MRRRRQRREQIARWSFAALVALVVFGLGIALGEALHDNPKPGGKVTLERTFRVPRVPPGSTAVP